MSRNRYGGSSGGGGQDPYAISNGYGNLTTPAEYDPYGNDYGDRYTSPRTTSPVTTRSNYSTPRPQRSRQESSAEKQIGDVLDRIRIDWDELCDQEKSVPVFTALQLLDNTSVGKGHLYGDFQQSHQYLENALKGIVHEHHQGFNSSIGTFHKIQNSIQSSQLRLRKLKTELAQSKSSLGNTDPDLRKLAETSQNYDALIRTLTEVEELRLVPDQLEARISEKRFLTAVDVLQTALRRIRAPALDDIGALSELRSYLANQETALTDILIEELHDHLYLKSPYCQERWQSLAKSHSGLGSVKPDAATVTVRPFYEVLDQMDLSLPMVEDPARNPEADTFHYISLLVEALNKLGRLENAVNTIRQRLPVELFTIVNETNNEVDQKHPSSLRGGNKNAQGNLSFGKDTSVRTDVIYDLLRTLYSKFEAISEGHRVFHDVVKALLRREGVGNASPLLGSFKELWNLYQNEIKSLLRNYVTTDADVYHFSAANATGTTKQDGKDKHMFQFSNADAKSVSMTTEYQDLENIIRSTVPGLITSTRKQGEDRKKVGGKGDSMLARTDSRRLGGPNNDKGSADSQKSLVEPSVFNMSLLLPPTLAFLQRLKSIVPPSSDLAKSTLTTFLDTFLVNVFLPQLEETLTKLGDSVVSESHSFQQDPQSANVSQRPVFKGTTSFFALITAFCRMLDKMPHDQALSQLIIDQMNTYYSRCYDWYKVLVSRSDSVEGREILIPKFAALLAEGPGNIHDTMQKLWIAEDDEQSLLEKETGLLIVHASDNPLGPKDVISNRETIQSLCVLYTSMKWLAIKVEQLRYITRNDVDSSRNSAHRPLNRRWTMLNDKDEDDAPVYLPMTQETVK